MVFNYSTMTVHEARNFLSLKNYSCNLRPNNNRRTYFIHCRAALILATAVFKALIFLPSYFMVVARKTASMPPCSDPLKIDSLDFYNHKLQ